MSSLFGLYRYFLIWGHNIQIFRKKEFYMFLLPMN